MSDKQTMSILGLYNYDHTIFDLLEVPAGLDKQLLIDNICMEFSDLSVYYTNATIMKSAINVWSHKHIDSWQRMYDALTSEYSPIENYNKIEHFANTGIGKSSGTNTNKATSFESTTLAVTDASELSSSGENTVTHDATIHGNIGVTTNQQMIEAELHLRKNTMYDIISMEFKNEFLIQIY